MYASKDHLLVMSGVTVDIEDGTLFASDDFDSTQKDATQAAQRVEAVAVGTGGEEQGEGGGVAVVEPDRPAVQPVVAVQVPDVRRAPDELDVRHAWR